jgi:serine/threonine-protein kinase
VEKAILWAMALHPDERPATVLAFREALLGSREIPAQFSSSPRPAPKTQPIFIFSTEAERWVGYAALGLFLLGLLVTLMR